MSKQIKSVLNSVSNSISGQQPSGNSLYACKIRFSLIGTVGAGKSTIVSLIGITTQTLGAARGGFVCRIIESNSNIYGDMSNLRSGRFPDKTAALQPYATEAGIILAKKKTFGLQQLQMPICDVAGEDLQLLIKQYSNKIGVIGNVAYSASQQLTRYVKECDGMIICVDASRAVLGHEGNQLNQEADTHLHHDPDVNLVRILNDVFNYRDQIHRPLKGIALVITKWDELKPYLELQGLDLFNPMQNDMQVFMDTFYPSVSQAIKSYMFTNPKTRINFFPMYVEIERNEDGSSKHRADGTVIVKAKQSAEITDARKPSYGEQSIANLIDWLLEFAG